MSAPPPNPPAAAPSDQPPLIYISYSRRDQVWLDTLLVWLKPLAAAGHIRIFSDLSIEPGRQWDPALRGALAEAALGIVLLSPDWLGSEYGVQVELPALSSRSIIPILVHACNWRELGEIAKWQVLSADGKSLSEVGRTEQDRTFQILIGQVRRLLQIPSEPTVPEQNPSQAPSEPGFSPTVQRIRQVASLLAGSRPQQHSVDPECLVFAFLEDGQHRATPLTASQFLWNALAEATRKRYPELRHQRFPLMEERPAAQVSDPGLEVYTQAAELSSQTAVGGVIHARHLLAALLVEHEVEPLFRELALDLPPLRNAFVEFVLQSVPEEPPEEWYRFLALASPPESEDEAGEAAIDSRVIASYQSDDWKGRDLLNIRRDVNALAALAAGWNVHPPLSIGLFGEWGTGKSFFMRQMRKRVKQLALAAQKSGKPQRECAYYKNIAQIEFNAWHYMGGDNLWACLVEHIFSHLGLPQDSTAEQLERRQKVILAKIDTARNMGQQAAGRKLDLERRKQEAEVRVAQARTEKSAKERVLEQEKSEVWQTIKTELSGSLVEEILGKIPETAKLQDDVQTVREFSVESQTAAGRVRLQWNLLRHDPERRGILYWMIGGAAAAYGLLILMRAAAPSLRLLMQPAFQALVPVISALAVTVTKFRPVLKNIGQVVSFFESRNQQITSAVAKAEELHHRQIARLEGEVKQLDEHIKQAEQERQQHEGEIAALERELATTDANQLLAEFIKSRVDAEDYRKHLGTVALVRRDFERLSDLFHSQRADEERGTERVDDTTVNRIVLYIDDLDRCPPEKVVDVLQAIHLLLAFPIFVVVVAVDSRWISRSLEQCYSWLVPEIEDALGEAPDGENLSRIGSGATAHDYLEKIFQIPFWLAPMDSTACKLLMRGLVKVDRDERTRVQQLVAGADRQETALKAQAAAAGTTGSPPSQPAGVADKSASVLDPDGPSQPVPPASPTGESAAHEFNDAEVIDLAPRQLDIEDVELLKIDELAGLIGRSPRVAKRFMNCYRLLKARMDERELQEFLNGRFQDAMEILAILVGAPSIARTVFNALLTAARPPQNRSVIESLEDKLSPEALMRSEGVEVLKLLGAATPEHLKSLGGMVKLVSRFSFESYSEVAAVPRGIAYAGQVSRNSQKQHRKAGKRSKATGVADGSAVSPPGAPAPS